MLKVLVDSSDGVDSGKVTKPGVWDPIAGFRKMDVLIVRRFVPTQPLIFRFRQDTFQVTSKLRKRLPKRGRCHALMTL